MNKYLVKIFTKHLQTKFEIESDKEINDANDQPSREKVHHLFQLFGCEYREGLPESAPLLRPRDSVCQQDGQLDEPSLLPNFAMGELEAELHDPGRLPHLHSEEEMILQFMR